MGSPLRIFSRVFCWPMAMLRFCFQVRHLLYYAAAVGWITSQLTCLCVRHNVSAVFAGTLIKLAAEICFIIRVFFAQYVVLLFPDIVSVSSFLFSTWKGRRTATDESTEEVYKSFCKKSDLKRSQDDEPETQCDCTDLNTSRFLSAVTREAKLELHAG